MQDEQIKGYADRLSARPGEVIEFKVSSPDGPFGLEFIRFTGPSSGGTHKGERLARPASLKSTYPGGSQESRTGSLLRVGDFPRLDSFSIELSMMPTLLEEGDLRALVGWSGPASPGLYVGPEGLVLRLGPTAELSCPLELIAGDWYDVLVSYDGVAGRATVGVASRRSNLPQSSLLRADAEGKLEPGLGLGAGDLALGAAWGSGSPAAHFNGKIARPRISDLPPAGPHVVAAWDFAGDFNSRTIPNYAGDGLDAEVLNMAVRAVRGPSWSGRSLSAWDRPEEYDAIHFHDDALEDLHWDTSFVLEIPTDWTSGVYAALVSDGVGEDQIPFWVRAKAGEETAVLFLAPTNTYMAYGNEISFLVHEEKFGQAKDRPFEYDPGDQYLKGHPEIGISAYDLHRDGVGCMFSSRRRPIVNMRPGYESWLSGGLRHFSADLVLIELLEREGIPYAVATDEDLDTEGIALLDRHRVVITGSHPEYPTEHELDSLLEYLDGGGRMMYLGGNGFHGTCCLSPYGRHVLELRRAHSDGPFQAPQGEQHYSFEPVPGGPWRNRDRAPQRVAGIGYGAKGWAAGRPYDRREGVDDPRWNWVFEGVPDGDLIGEQSPLLGAAGDEMDRLDLGLGSPPQAVVLASAVGFSDFYQPALDEVIDMQPGLGGSENPNVRADMVAYQSPGDGGVFSVGSICWIGTMASDHFENHVARITLNVLRRFAAEGPIVDPVVR